MATSQSTAVEYRDIPGFPGYRVGSDGSVWSAWKTSPAGRQLAGRWKRLKTPPGARGYLRVNLFPVTGRYRTFRVHRLVLETFAGPCPPGMECRHFPDTDKTNNRLDNLSWGTPVENRGDNHTTGAYGRGEAHTQAKLTAADVRAIRGRHAAGTARFRDLAAEFGVSVPTISGIVNRRSWKHLD